MLWRTMLRGTAEGALTLAAQAVGANVTSSKDTPVSFGDGLLAEEGQEILSELGTSLTSSQPWIIVFADDKKFGVGPRQYRTEGTVTIEVRAEMPSRVVNGIDVGDKDCAALLDSLCDLVENTLLASKGYPIQLAIEAGSATATPVGGNAGLFRGFVLTSPQISVDHFLAIAAVNGDGTITLTEPFDGSSGTYRVVVGSFADLFEQIDKVETFTEEARVETENHVMSATIEIVGHISERFEPVIRDALNGIDLYIDSVNIFSPGGTFTGEPFPVPSAPRTTGPDGRTEIPASIDLTQE